MGQLLSELGFVVRLWLRRPLVSLAIVLTIALGIGANTAIFKIAESLWLEPLPFAEADRIVQVQRAFSGTPNASVSAKQFTFWRSASEPFESLTAYSVSPLQLYLDGPTLEPLEARRVTASFFATFGARPAHGRVFLDTEDVAGGPLVVILSHRIWARRFGEDPEIVGSSLTLGGALYTVVGVMSQEFAYPAGSDIWIPAQLDEEDRQASFQATGRLREGIEPSMAEQAMQAVEERYLELVGDDRNESLVVRPLRTALYDSTLANRFRIYGGCALVILLVACVNVANLLLGGLGARRQELAVRSALGASAGQLLRLTLIESFLLAVLGGAAALVVCRTTIDLISTVALRGVQRLAPITVDMQAFLFAAGLTLMVGLAIGLVVWMRVLRLAPSEAIKQGGARVKGGRRIRAALVVAEVALTVPALLATILLSRSLIEVSQTDPGVDTSNLLTLEIALSEADYSNGEAWERLCQDLVPEVAALPGVEEAGMTSGIPFGLAPNVPFVIEGQPDSKLGALDRLRIVSPGYLEALKVPLVQGRLFNDADHREGRDVLIVNETMAKHYWPDKSALGQRVTLGPPFVPELDDPTREIVGVIGDVREGGLARVVPSALYIPQAQIPDLLAKRLVSRLPMVLVLRSSVDPLSLSPLVETAVRRFDPGASALQPRTMDQVISSTLASQSGNAWLIGVLTVLAVGLASIGIYAVVAATVQESTREIGIRMVAGADRWGILALFVRRGLVSIFYGALIGLIVSWILAQLLENWLASFVTVSLQDPVSYVLVVLALFATGLLAVSLPALRATRIQPSVAMRVE